MNILFLDDDLQRHHLFQAWLKDARSQRQRAGCLNLFRRRSRRVDAAPLKTEVAFTVEDAIQALMECERFDIAFLDHDLDGRTFVEERKGTGTEVAEWIATMKSHERPRHIIVHSHNPAGARRMADILLNRGCPVEEWPFGSPAFLRSLRDL